MGTAEMFRLSAQHSLASSTIELNGQTETLLWMLKPDKDFDRKSNPAGMTGIFYVN